MTQPAASASTPLTSVAGMAVVARLSKGFFWIAFAALTLAFLINAGIGGYFIHRTNQFLKSATRVEATVIRLEPNAGDASMTYPVIQFFDTDQNPHEIRSRIASNPPSYHVGEKVHVYYDPANPFDARIDSFFSLWLIPFIFGVVAAVVLLLLIVLGVLALVVRWAVKPAIRAHAVNSLSILG